MKKEYEEKCKQKLMNITRKKGRKRRKKEGRIEGVRERERGNKVRNR